jgi:hypothetical protein
MYSIKIFLQKQREREGGMGLRENRGEKKQN